MMQYSAEKILEGLRCKDPSVFRYLYRQYGKMIVSYVRKNSGSDEDAKETVQKVMVALWRAAIEGRYQEGGKMDNYIYKLVSNTWRMELRRKRQLVETQLENINGGADSGEDVFESEQAAKQKNVLFDTMHLALDNMAEPCKSIIQHYHLKEIALQDLAIQMGFEYNNLRKRIFDCRKKLRRLVEDLLKQRNELEYGK